MHPTSGQLLALGLAWLGYFALHSLLASLTIKRRFAAFRPRWIPAYRLGFNVVAVVALLPILAMMHLWRGLPLWQWQGAAGWLADGLALAALAAFVWSLRYYDGGEFSGMRQLRSRRRRVEDQETLRISPLHRHVRHPWYALALVLIWTRDMDPAMLLSAAMITAYFVIGSRLEEGKLLVYHGPAYAEYRRRVPGLVPRPWRFLSADEAERLVAGTGREFAPGD